MNIFLYLPIILTWLSGIAFIIYGFLCLVTGGMEEEFERYGLVKYRKLVGFLELVGGLGCLLGLIYPFILVLSSAGLTLLMLLGIIVRLRIKDSLYLILPAFILMLINVYIFQNIF